MPKSETYNVWYAVRDLDDVQISTPFDDYDEAVDFTAQMCESELVMSKADPTYARNAYYIIPIYVPNCGCHEEDE